MLTGIKPLRSRPIPVGGTWSLPASWNVTTATTQTMYIPIYQVRNCPDRVFKRYANALILGASATMRQRMATNGYEVEVCPVAVSDGTYWNSLRQTISIWTGYAGATNVGGSQTSLVRGGIGVTLYDDKTYANACANMWHEMVWAELGIYFPAGSRPTGHTSDVLISSWAEVGTLITDCVANGASSGWTSDHPYFCNRMRCGQRSEAFPTITPTIPFNATAAQVKTAIEALPFIRTATQWPSSDIVVTGGPLPTAITISFDVGGGFPGQYYHTNVVPFTVAVNSLTGGSSPAPSLSVTQAGTAWGTPTSLIMSLTTTGSPTAGTFTLSFGGGVDRILEIVGPGTTDTPASRVNVWLTTVCSANGWST